MILPWDCQVLCTTKSGRLQVFEMTSVLVNACHSPHASERWYRRIETWSFGNTAKSKRMVSSQNRGALFDFMDAFIEERSQIRVEPLALIEIPLCLSRLSLPKSHQTTIGVGFVVLRVELNRSAEVGDSAVKPSHQRRSREYAVLRRISIGASIAFQVTAYAGDWAWALKSYPFATLGE